MSNCICRVKYYRTNEHVQKGSFSKKDQQQAFLKLTKLFILRKNYEDKVVTFSESKVKLKVILTCTLFLILLMSAVI